MRRLNLLTLLLAALVWTSCQKEPEVRETTYTFLSTDEMAAKTRAIAESAGLTYVGLQVVFCEYYDGKRVATNFIDELRDEKRYRFTANSRTEFLTVRLDLIVETGGKDGTISLYFSNVYYLDEGKDTLITYDAETMSSKTEPI